MLAELRKAARDAAGDRSRGQAEELADRPVALVPREEPVEDLPALLGQFGERLVHRQRLVQALERVLRDVGLGLLLELLARRGAQMVDAEPACELGQPGLNGRVVAEPVEVLVGAGEDLLEDVLGRVLRESEALNGNRVDVAREPLDECAPRFVVAAAAAGDEDGIAELAGQL